MKSLILFILIGFAQVCAAQTEVLVWSDEFEGTGAPDPSNWTYDLGAGGWGNNEVQTYTNSTVNSRQENGKLIIEAKKQGNTWTSARLITNNKHEFKYGRVVFRAKLPVGSGTWPALWMLGENFATKGWPACGEVDIMEHVGKDPGWVHSALHTPSSHGATVNTQGKYITSCQTEFHNYEMNWKYNKIEFRIDSVLFYTYSPTVRNGSTWPFDLHFFLIMNVAMGGNWGSDPQYETGGLKNGINPTLSSATMEVEYVRVYQYPASVEDPTDGNGSKDTEHSFLFPNPTDGKIRIDLPFGTNATGTIYDLYGKNVFHFIANDLSTQIDVSGLSKGLYCIALQSEGRIRTNKLIIR